MAFATFAVAGMTCGHCVDAVTGELTKLTGISKVDVDLESGRVTLTSREPVDLAEVDAAVTEAGYRLITN